MLSPGPSWIMLDGEADWAGGDLGLGCWAKATETQQTAQASAQSPEYGLTERIDTPKPPTKLHSIKRLYYYLTKTVEYKFCRPIQVINESSITDGAIAKGGESRLASCRPFGFEATYAKPPSGPSDLTGRAMAKFCTTIPFSIWCGQI
jgi:hypothetical protein